MHEMALCESIVSILEDQAQSQKFDRVKKVFLEVGRLSCVEPEALRFSFSAVTKNTLAAGADLVILDIEGQAWCLPCGKTVSIPARYAPCPECGSYQLQVTSGEELRIKELEVE